MNNTILIKAPQIISNNRFSKLETEIVCDNPSINLTKTLYFEVDGKWEKYLTQEVSDAFVLALLEYAMENRCDLHFEAPMTEDLKYQLERYLIPAYAKNIDGLYPINLCGEVTSNKIESQNVTGTGFSGGVDSFYTVLSHMNINYKTKGITHLLLAVNGAATTGLSEEINKKWFMEETNRFEPVSKELGMEFIGVNSNISLINKNKRVLKGGSIIPTSGFVHALRKLFGTYYWASAYEANIFKFSNIDGGYMETFAVPLVSVNGLRFYHDGCEISRIGKVKYIADNPIVQRNLTVCSQPVSCGHCPKCLRTMAELNSLKKLELFSEVFNVNEYKKKYTSKLAREFAVDHPPFTTDIKASMKKNGVRIPFSVYLKQYFIFIPFYYLKKKLRNNVTLMKLYYLNGWDEKLGEGKHSSEIIQSRLEGKDK